MAQMIRNVNLEEIDSDAPLGIDALKDQTLPQKILCWGCVGLAMLLNVTLPLVFDVPVFVCVFIFLVLLAIGVCFGCNYTKDFTYGRYLYCQLFKPEVRLKLVSTEDVAYIRAKADKIKQAEDELLAKQAGIDQKEQKKLLIKLAVFFVVIIALIMGAFIYKSLGSEDETHHQVTSRTDWSIDAKDI